MDWNQVLCLGLGLLSCLMGSMAQLDIEHEEWTANWTDTWKLGNTWPPLDHRSPSLFPNITEVEIQSRQTIMVKSTVDGRDTSCYVIQKTDTHRIYQCNLRIPGIDAKNDICDDISGANEYGCDWFDNQVTLCHRWRDRYTQSITFCRFGEDMCSELDSRYMICACSVFYSWSEEQYYTYCDCKGALTDNYDDSCAFSYFGLLDTPTQDRSCQKVCSRSSTCKECATGWSLSSPGVVTFCMREDIDDLYGRREIWPCQEQYGNNTACSADYEPYSGDCEATTTTPTPSMTRGPEFARTDMTNTTTPSRQSTVPVQATVFPDKGIGRTTSTHLTPTSLRASTDNTKKTTTSLRVSTDNTEKASASWYHTSPSQTSLIYSTTMTTENGEEGNHGNQGDTNSRLLTDTAVAGIIFGATGLVVLLIILLLIMVLCLRVRNQRQRRDSSSKATLRADEFTIWRSTDNVNIAHGNSMLSRASTSIMSSVFNDNVSAVTDDSGPIYKDYFQVVDQDKDRIGASVESLYYFKLDHTPNGSISGIERDKEFDKAKGELGSNMSIDSCTMPNQPSTSDGSPVVGIATKDAPKDEHMDTMVNTEPENPYYFKLNNKNTDQGTKDLELTNKQDVHKQLPEIQNGTDSLSAARQESVEENPYYFKLTSKNETCAMNGSNNVPVDGNQIENIMLNTLLNLNGAKTEEYNGNSICPIKVISPNCNDDNSDGHNDYQSLQKSNRTSAVPSATPNVRYSYLLKPNQCPEDNDDYLSLRKIKPNQETCPTDQLCEDHDYFKLKTPSSIEYQRQCPNTSDPTSSNLIPSIGTADPADVNNDTDNLSTEERNIKQQHVDDHEDGQNNDYQVLRKATQQKQDIIGDEKENDYQLLRKRSLKM
ncbi:uncharacterized protein [Amphiura filiformis]|uniref:uncharacterized protein isoform X2 n=1 Tax=Amphiura filiformis TaxID=82378 RepID=UPI003B20B7E5